MTLEALIAQLAPHTRMQAEQIQPTMRLKEDLFLTSFSMLMILQEIQQRYALTAEVQQLKDVATVEDLYQALTRGDGRAT
jgi:acyl carrier protein